MRMKKLVLVIMLLGILFAGERYILGLGLKQSHFSLDIGDHIKDSMNAVKFTIPVDKTFYDSVTVGTPIVNKFRSGSFLMSGSFGDWKIKVISKTVIKE